MLIKILYLIGGISGIGLGIFTMIRGGFYHCGLFINVQECRYSVGSIFIAIGIYAFYDVFKKANYRTK